MNQVSDINIAENIPLPSPKALCKAVARTPARAQSIAQARKEIRDIIFGEDKRLLVVVGPCSIHDVNAGREYAERLAALAAEVEDTLLLVMRVYFEKPRTSVGWKGLIMDPDLDGSNDIAKGLHMARKFLCTVVDLGLATATELLDPITPQYIADLICWSAIGARTSESQTHRQMASGLSMPLGFKNLTSGELKAAINAIQASSRPQTFLGVSRDGVASAVSTRGNPDCHLILRGGASGPNYDATAVRAAAGLLADNALSPSIMIDASHDNSAKDYRRQPEVFRTIVEQFCTADCPLVGIMLESNLIAGNQPFPQPVNQLTYGQSITDSCIDWAVTEALIREGHKALSRSR